MTTATIVKASLGPQELEFLNVFMKAEGITKTSKGIRILLRRLANGMAQTFEHVHNCTEVQKLKEVHSVELPNSTSKRGNNNMNNTMSEKKKTAKEEITLKDGDLAIANVRKEVISPREIEKLRKIYSDKRIAAFVTDSEYVLTDWDIWQIGHLAKCAYYFADLRGVEVFNFCKARLLTILDIDIGAQLGTAFGWGKIKDFWHMHAVVVRHKLKISSQKNHQSKQEPKQTPPVKRTYQDHMRKRDHVESFTEMLSKPENRRNRFEKETISALEKDLTKPDRERSELAEYYKIAKFLLEKKHDDSRQSDMPGLREGVR